MTTDLLDRVDAYIDTLAARIPGLRLERSRGICLMLERLLELEAGISQPQPAQAGTTDDTARNTPALEPAPATEGQPARKSQTSSSRRRDGKVGIPIPDEKLQQIADEYTLCEGLSLGEFAQRLFDKSIYHTTSATGAAVPVHWEP